MDYKETHISFLYDDLVKYFAKEIEKRIGVQTDTTAIDKELANYESKLKEVDLNKTLQTQQGTVGRRKRNSQNKGGKEF